jgi:nucleotide-binding universal stress UspA family protein
MPTVHPSQAQSRYASIMVPMDLSADGVRRAQLATDLADRFDSRLIGVAAHPIAPPLYFETPVPGIESAIDLEKKNASRQIAAAEAAFRKVVGTRNRIEWRQAHGFATEFAIEQARAADLIVASQKSPGEAVNAMSVHPGDLVMAAGRPVLFVPTGIEFLAAKNIVIAWKDTREARRAVADAMPFLKAAEGVSVVTFGTDERAARDVCTYLGCHGIAADMRRKDVAADAVAEELMRAAEADAADLVICGAYGHSRATEWAFGGVTRDLLANARLCCLMAH